MQQDAAAYWQNSTERARAEIDHMLRENARLQLEVARQKLEIHRLTERNSTMSETIRGIYKLLEES